MAKRDTADYLAGIHDAATMALIGHRSTNINERTLQAKIATAILSLAGEDAPKLPTEIVIIEADSAFCVHLSDKLRNRGVSLKSFDKNDQTGYHTNERFEQAKTYAIAIARIILATVLFGEDVIYDPRVDV